MTKVLRVGDLAFLKNVLLVPQVKKDLISEGQFTQDNNWGLTSRGKWKRLLDDNDVVIMEGWIQDSSNLYVVDSAYVPIMIESNSIEVLNGNYYDTVFAGTVDEPQEESERERIRSANYDM